MRARLLTALLLFALTLAALLALPGLSQGPSPAQAPPPAQSQTVTVPNPKGGPGSPAVPIEIREQYLGRSGDKTVVKFVLSVARADLKGSASQPRSYTFYLVGEAKDAEGRVVDSFRVPVDVDMSQEGEGRVSASFLRSFPPGNVTVVFQLAGMAGQALGVRALPLVVPAMSSEFVAADAGTGKTGLPTAAAIVLEAENREKPAPGAGSLVRIIAPKRDVPVGLVRIDAEVKPPVERVEFFLDEKRLLVRNRPPYTVEIDLGRVPKKQTLKVLGFDKQGNLLDADAWAIGERDARITVRILEVPRKDATGEVEVKVAIQAPTGAQAKELKLFADDKLLKTWNEPPYTVRLAASALRGATLLRASAFDEEGKEFSDIKFLKGSSRFVAAAEVSAVELHISVFDAEGRFQKGLKREDFEVLEDGVPQKVGTFEFAEALPLSLGIVIDGSGSMRDAMPVVKEAATGFVQRLVGEKDQGFVIEFHEQPALLAPLGKSPIPMIRAITDVRAGGETALWDSIVMGLYQFRGVPGRKAVVVLTDGEDNHSWTTYDVLRRYARTAGLPIYFVGLRLSMLDVGLKGKLREMAVDTGADAFFISKAKELEEVYRRIEIELRSQYFLTYLTESKKPDSEFRAVEVRMKKSGLKAKTIRGYFP